MPKKTRIAVTALAAALLTGCASYRTGSEFTVAEPEAGSPASKVVIYRGPVAEPHNELGIVEAIVKKATAFQADPTKVQVNNVLAKKAAKLGADAVKNVQYQSGVGFTTWGYLEANGMAVEFTDP